MGVRSKNLVGLATFIVSSLVFVNAAVAQNADDETPQNEAAERPAIWEAFQDAYYRRSGNFYDNRGIPGNITWIIGPFPENNIAGDGRAVNRVYREVFTQQALSDPLIRTADVSNPFDTSLLLLPATETTSNIPPNDFGLETIPAPTALPPAPTGPVRALY
ncbi:hypothetical protein H6G89_07275 [Oscillatoria sp. FACHB-1407]|uniref:hypothetical protein n=1 Tax=Oscillatoria sp. FACHB-1407 TaxID=2692847 RepID=UPI001689D2F9|nr:hypothetical protein [Oscillatoria sp. FACHB-1407]MBD2460843.1 hypothetical protein [Oscillatoria sp. FACHB-1407]